MESWKRRLLYAACAVAGSLTFGTTGLVLIEDWPVFDAFYMALTTITTVGYGEIRPLSHIGRVFNSVFLLTGVCAMLLSLGALTQTIIELELGDHFEKRRVRKMIEKLRDHYIVCGFGRVGRGAAQELARSGAPFIVIERDEDKVERAMRAGMIATLGDATSDEDLRGIGIERAKGLIAALSSDAENTFVILSARTLNPLLSISARVLEENSEQKLRRAGADAVLTPYTITGSRLAQAILRPHVLQFLDIATGAMGLHVDIEQVRVDETSPSNSRSLAGMQLRRETGVIILAIRRSGGEMIFNPDPETPINGGDYLIAMGEPEQLRKLERLVAKVHA